MDAFLEAHLKIYPQMEAIDIIKLCYQREFGCEHLVNTTKTLERLKQECQQLPRIPLRIEPISNTLARLYLGQLEPIEAYTINQLFIITAKTIKGNEVNFKAHLNRYQQLCHNDLLNQEIDTYLAKGITAVSHSLTYHQAYEPHYRVIRQDLLHYFSIFKQINSCLLSHLTLLIAIDGKCGSGKSTLARLLQEVYDSPIFHMDDFFLQGYQRTPDRLAQAGENVDHERFLSEVLIPLSKKQDVLYQSFDCSQMQLSSQIKKMAYSPINIIEGTYSLHPDLFPYYDLKIALTLNDNEQMQRIINRNGTTIAKKFEDTWIPLENKYFKQMDIFKKVDILYKTDIAHKEIIL